MAETFGGFNSVASPNTTLIRQKLRETMVMGFPHDSAVPTFYFDRVVSWDDHDQEGKPWDWEATPASDTAETSVQQLCAYEFFSPLGRQGAVYTEAGEFNPTHLVLTMFEDELDIVKGFSYCTVGESAQKWYFRYWRPSYSIADMTVHQVHCVAGAD